MNCIAYAKGEMKSAWWIFCHAFFFDFSAVRHWYTKLYLYVCYMKQLKTYTMQKTLRSLKDIENLESVKSVTVRNEVVESSNAKSYYIILNPGYCFPGGIKEGKFFTFKDLLSECKLIGQVIKVTPKVDASINQAVLCSDQETETYDKRLVFNGLTWFLSRKFENEKQVGWNIHYSVGSEPMHSVQRISEAKELMFNSAK